MHCDVGATELTYGLSLGIPSTRANQLRLEETSADDVSEVVETSSQDNSLRTETG